VDPSQGWAEGLVAEGRALDPSTRRILAFDYVGACGGIDAPIDTADQADAVALLLEALGIDALEAFVGYSYGALVGLRLAVRHPRRVRKLVAVSGAFARFRMPRRGARCSARRLRSLQADEQGLSLARRC
jgi:homoserine O-acetyltransferase